MKKIFLLAIVAIFMLNGCDDNQPEGGFEMSYLTDFEIFAGLNTLDTHVFEFTLSTNFTDYLANNGVAAENVETIVPKYIRMSNLSSNVEYNILRRARLFISNTDGTAEFEAAFRETVPLNTQFDLDLIPTLVEVPEQLSNNQFKAILKLNLNQVPPQSIDTRLFLTFQVILKQ